MGTCYSEELNKNRAKKQKRSQFKTEKKAALMNEHDVKNKVDECFDRFDRNHDGFLDTSEVIELVKHSYSQTKKENQEQSYVYYRRAARNLMKNLKLQDESQINREEFYHFYKGFL